jgi:hypothetical protein
MCLELCHWLHTNRQFILLILYTDEAMFTHNGISKNVTGSDELTTIHIELWRQISNIVSLSVCGVV